MNYIQIEVRAKSDVYELLIPQLTEIGFEGFEELDHALLAFITEDDYSEQELMNILQPQHIFFNKTIIPKQNWNEVWESNFEPVIVDDFVGVRAHFHAPFENVQHEIVITPKMSFGTGHHATTYMVMQLMQHITFSGKTVFDFGTGTGILAILAEQLGAAQVLAVDYDDWCIQNATENIETNHCNKIEIQQLDSAKTGKEFEIVIANINKNILLDNTESLFLTTSKSGVLILSGLLQEDEQDILAAFVQEGFEHIKTILKNNWIAMQFVK